MVPLVKKCEGEHSSQLENTIGSQILVKMNDHFSVGLSAEAMAPSFKFPSKVEKVVDLPVEHNPCSSIFIEYRLLSASQINDSQAAHTKRRARSNEQPVFVGTPVDQCLTHSSQDIVVHPAIRAGSDNSCDSTHGK